MLVSGDAGIGKTSLLEVAAAHARARGRVRRVTLAERRLWVPVPGKRGPKIGTSNPLTIEVAQLQRTNARLTQRLARAEAIIEIQKKVAALLGMPLTSKDDAP